MQRKTQRPILPVLLLVIFLLSACSAAAPEPTATNTPQPTATITLTPTNTATPTRTPRPTATPNLEATQRFENYGKEVESYFDLGYLSTTDGSTKELDNFTDSWAQLGWYQWYPLDRIVTDFAMSAHFKWESAYKNADESGCGFAFAIQDDYSHYAVFLDRSKIIFLDADASYGGYSRSVGKTRGSGTVKFGNPGEADFALIINGLSAFVLVDDELIGEYTLAKSRILRGNVGLTILSGTNKDYGTRCQMTDMRIWTPK